MENLIENEWEILTDDGWSDFEGLKITKDTQYVHITLSSSYLKCSLNHKILTTVGWLEAKHLYEGCLCYTSYGIDNIIKKEIINKDIKLYDIIGVKKNSRYYTNNILSHNCDEFAHLGPNLAEEFIASVFPTISSAKTSKLVIISTPNGLNHYHKLWKESENNNNDFARVEGNWRENPLRTQDWADEQRKKLGDVKYRQEIECTFEGSSYTLIDGAKLSTIPLEKMIYDKDGLEVFEQPQEGHNYVITVDVSRGRHLDYSAFVVTDITSMPYKIVVAYKNNDISTLEYPHLIYNTARQYNDAFLLIEVNDLGEEVSNIIWYEYEYENIYFTKDNELSQARGYPGVRTTSKVKGLGCSVLKELIEKDQLQLCSHRIIEELSLFVIHRKSYASSDPLVNDDLCTALWLLSWLTKQDIFQQLNNNNLRNILTERKQQYINDTMTPFGFYQNNLPDDVVKPGMDSRILPSKDMPYHLTDDQIELLNS